MSELVVLAFPTETGARQALGVVDDLQSQDVIALDDAATVTRGADGKPEVKQATSVVGAGALGGAFWGLLFGLLFFVPLLGMAVGAAMGALAGSMSDVGIDDEFVRRVRDEVKEGTSALFVMTGNVVADRVLGEFRGTGAHLVSTNLSAEQEAKLREVFQEPTEV
jgi:uncharacterized membrane protein